MSGRGPARRPNPWLALDATADPLERARELRRAHAEFAGAGAPEPASAVRGVIAESWRRSASAGVRPEGHVVPRVHSDPELRDLREEHPLARMMPTFRNLLLDVAQAVEHLMAVCSADGVLLWVEGSARARVAAEDRMNFAEGTLWSEAGAGTNALGTALAVRHPVQVFAAEHYNASVHPWTCSASPVFEPRTGRLLGTVDLTGPFRMVHPHSLALVTAAAGAAAGSVHQEMWRHDERLREQYVRRLAHLGRRPTGVVTSAGRVVMANPVGWLGTHVGIPGESGIGFLPGGATFRAEEIAGGSGYLVWAAEPGEAPPRRRLRLRVLGGAEAWLDDQPLHLSPRHAEILTLLAAAPGGLSAERLGAALHGPGGSPTTVRSEVSRLRRQLGSALVTRPYRLEADVEGDALDAIALAADGRADEARALAEGRTLLPGSTAPGIARLRTELVRALGAGIAADPGAA